MKLLKLIPINLDIQGQLNSKLLDSCYSPKKIVKLTGLGDKNIQNWKKQKPSGF
ncbi:MAG: hypothetical protein MK008_12985 [Bdellovibrionales bacterium]|nr:hypothetical protein [Bdellovibrionales bacterium]